MVAQATTRGDLVRRFVLDSICDDYEHLTISIGPDVTKLGVGCGLTIEKAEIVQALAELLEIGWAKAYRLHNDGRSKWAELREGMPSPEEMEDPMGAWFYITEAGMKAELADWTPWPFDDEGELKKNWTPPEG